MAASSATISLSRASTYITSSTTIGLKTKLRSPTGKLQATSSCATFDLLIWSSAEYCEEWPPPP